MHSVHFLTWRFQDLKEAREAFLLATLPPPPQAVPQPAGEPQQQPGQQPLSDADKAEYVRLILGHNGMTTLNQHSSSVTFISMSVARSSSGRDAGKANDELVAFEQRKGLDPARRWKANMLVYKEGLRVLTSTEVERWDGVVGRGERELIT